MSEFVKEKKKRRWVTILQWFIGIQVLLVILLSCLPSEPEKQADTSALPTTAKLTEPKLAGLTDSQQSSLSMIRGTAMELVFCTGELDATQAKLDAINRGDARPIEAYSSAETGIRDCRKAKEDLVSSDPSVLKKPELIKIFEETIPSCVRSVEKSAGVMELAQQVLDGDTSVKTAQRYKALKNEALTGQVECKMGLGGLAEAEKIPESEVDFLSLNPN